MSEKIIELSPMKYDRASLDEIERRIKNLFVEHFYLPLLKEIRPEAGKVFNSIMDDFIEAIRTGRIYYEKGMFRGSFNAAISRKLKKLGAKWDTKNRAWKISRDLMNVEINHAILASDEEFQKRMQRMRDRLDDLSVDVLVDKLKIEDVFDRTIYRMEKNFEKSVKGIMIHPTLNYEQRKFIAKEYTKNMKYYIKDWWVEEIVKLREKVEKRAFAGQRYEGMIKSLADSHEVSAKKAKFWARQETHLLLAKFRETRYADAGVHEYKWRSVIGTTDHPVRKRHKELSDESQLKGKIFRFDDPPNTSEDGTPPRYNNPGEDFNCRCVAVPVVRFH